MVVYTILNFLKSFLLSLFIAIIIVNFIFSIVVVDGPSMEPTIQHKDKLLLLKYPLYFREPARGEIVVFKSPINFSQYYIKRVIAISGDIVEIREGKIYVNNEEVKEEYIEDNAYTESFSSGFWQLDKDMYFLLGDNRNPNKSTDSRYFGPIKKSDIIGIAKSRILPLDNIKFNL